MPVSRWLVDAIEPQPGHRVLELAAGPGDTGFLAAELIAPGGSLISSDISEAMLDVARARAEELGIANAEFKALDAEWIDLPTASLDAVVCRWGYMLLADPGAALRETRRVLRPGGRVALAAWADAEANPWAWRAQGVVREQGLVGDPIPGRPGMFAWSDPDQIVAALQDAGFAEPRVETIDFELPYSSLDDFWSATRDFSSGFRDLVAGLNERQSTALRDGFTEALAEHRGEDGSYRFPARTNVATAEA